MTSRSDCNPGFDSNRHPAAPRFKGEVFADGPLNIPQVRSGNEVRLLAGKGSYVNIMDGHLETEEFKSAFRVDAPQR